MKLVLDGCWYGEAYGTAQAIGYCVSPIIGSYVHTESGDVDTMPYGGLLYTRGRWGKFAGQSSQGYGNIECEMGASPVVVGNGYGTNTVLYLRDATLVQGAPQFGSQGLRYQADDGRVVTGDESHLSPDHLLADYSEMGGVRIGQNQNGPGALVQFLPGSTLRLLEPGDCQFIRVNYYADSDSFAIGIVKLPEQRWVGYWLTRAELGALPVYVAPPDPPVPPDPPIPPIPPDPPVPPQPPVIAGDTFMEFARLDSSKVVPYIELRKSGQTGCVNLITPNGEVFSAHGDTRPAGTDGPWEQGQASGGQITYRADGVLFTWLIVPVDKLP